MRERCKHNPHIKHNRRRRSRSRSNSKDPKSEGITVEAKLPISTEYHSSPETKPGKYFIIFPFNPSLSVHVVMLTLA